MCFCGWNSLCHPDDELRSVFSLVHVSFDRKKIVFGLCVSVCECVSTIWHTWLMYSWNKFSNRLKLSKIFSDRAIASCLISIRIKKMRWISTCRTACTCVHVTECQPNWKCIGRQEDWRTTRGTEQINSTNTKRFQYFWLECKRVRLS